MLNKTLETYVPAKYHTRVLLTPTCNITPRMTNRTGVVCGDLVALKPVAKSTANRLIAWLCYDMELDRFITLRGDCVGKTTTSASLDNQPLQHFTLPEK